MNIWAKFQADLMIFNKEFMHQEWQTKCLVFPVYNAKANSFAKIINAEAENATKISFFEFRKVQAFQ